MQEVSPLDTPRGKYLAALMKDPENEKLLGAEPLEDFVQARLDIYLEEFETAMKETKSPTNAHDRAMIEMTAGLVELKIEEAHPSEREDVSDEDELEEDQD